MKLLFITVLLPLIRCQKNYLNEKLASNFSQVTSFNVIDEKYKEIKSVRSNKSGSVQQIQTLSYLFKERLQVLQETIRRVENITKTSNMPELDEDSIMWARDSNQSCKFQERGSYKQSICLTNSSVHIPIDIFQGDREMRRTAAWTSMIDRVWVQNLAGHPDLLWQYFGSTNGLLRFFPGTYWPLRYKDKDGEDVDLFDVRRRSWYLQGLSIPKDMLILIDSSGSSQGQALALMKHVTRSLLETLNENDQINVLTFPQDTNEISRPPCFPSFMKATFRNKQMVLDYTKKILSTGIANFSKALEAAFSFFENITSNGSEGFSNSHCNQMIMLLTDGGNEKPREVLRKHNAFQRIRIFTYLIGPISTDAPAIQWIAEKSRGHFYQIPSIVSIRSQTQDYVKYLSESKINMTNTHTWSSASIDYLNNELVVSISAPLFNRSSENKESQEPQKESNRSLLGVLGMDIPVRKFQSYVHEELGQYGYFFIINSQGFVLYHPRLQKMKEEFLSVDILDLETDVNMEEIRRKMINREKGEFTVEDFDDMMDEHHTNIKRRTYHYEPIEDTDFSYCSVKYDEVAEGIVETKITGSVNSEIFLNIHDSDVIINFKDFCSDIEVENATEIERFIILITGFNCDVDKLKGLIFDIIQTNSTAESWAKNKTLVSEDAPGVMLLFIETPNIFRTFPENISTAFDYLLPSYDRYRERISKTSQWFVASLEEETELNNETAKILLIARRVTKGNLTLAVIGGLVHEQWLQEVTFGSLVEPSNETYTASYLLDDGGFIITTSLVPPHGTDYVGRFFGEEDIEGGVMKDMIDKGIYEGHRSTSYLASCRELELAAFSPSLKSLLPFTEIFSPKWWLSVFVSQLAWLSSMLQVIMSFIETLAFGEVIFHEHEDIRESEYCAKELYKYKFAGRAHEDHSHEVDCGNCTKLYTSKMLKDLNLLVVTVTSEDACTCQDNSKPLIYKPQQNVSEAHLRSLFYRKSIPCQAHINEKEETYSSSIRILPTRGILCVPLMLLWRLVSRLSSI